MANQSWLMKCEPAAYTIEELERDGTTGWEGVRNFQARNFLLQMKKGDLAIFYASSADPSGATGIAEVVREAYPDPTALRKGHEYFEPKATRENPIWVAVDIGFVERFPRVVPIGELRSTPGLETMVILRKGSRLSVTPVTAGELRIVRRLGRG
ncbi:MAG TPA: EVE domain-containing protein [Thermoanaerobaculia bacterium]|nr:EVE domain-containing protein [Thermoanaerobaculia bacterium]